MDFFPAFFDVRTIDCLLVGGGKVGARKARLLSQAGARVHVVAPALCDELRDRAAAGEVIHHAERFRPEHLHGKRLVIVATNDADVNREASIAAKALGVPVNVVDNPQLCSFIVPAVVDRSPLIIGVTSGGNAPVLARVARGKIEALFAPAYGRLTALIGKFRERSKRRIPDVEQRRDFWQRVLDGPIAEKALGGREREAEVALEAALAHEQPGTSKGEVILLGAGPGAADLLTLRGLRLLQQADVVLYDRLVSPEVVDLARRDAERIYVGKQEGFHSLPQDRINGLLIALARAGKRVVRLKGGDPFMFGRGGEELEDLVEAGIAFQVVPGVTAASGCAAYAGIPLTHRDHAHSVSFVTGHLKDGDLQLAWNALVQPGHTLVFYMGLHALPVISERLIAHGLPADTPAALVENGTTDRQRRLISTIAELPALAVERRVESPALLMIGTVVSLGPKLQWFGCSEQASERNGAEAPGQPAVEAALA
jgi:uroporphyrin-III C-methyltransferase / precorrin-2 dehydrogenase / sirohydrochlorin ferrochelatase